MSRSDIATVLLLVCAAPAARAQAPLDPCTLLQQVLAPSDPVDAPYSQVGALEGDTLMIGSTLGDGLAPDSGTVLEFERAGDVWTPRAKIDAPDGAFQDYFGRSIDLQGDTLVVGSLCDSGSGYQSGAVYVFTRSAGTWVFAQKLVGSGVGAGDWFGSSVALDGDRLAVGCTREHHGSQIGAVYVFERAAGVWSQVQELLPDLSPAYEFGTDVVLDGDLLAVGAPQADFTTDSGDVYVYRLAAGAWQLSALLEASDAVPGNAFGSALALQRDAWFSWLLVGAPEDAPAGVQRAGAAYLYRLDHYAGTWCEQSKLTAPALEADGRFGCDVALSLLGRWAAIGERGASPGGAHLFLRASDVLWSHQVRLDTAAGAPGVTGASLALEGETIVQAPPAEVYQGALQVHSLPPGGLWTYCTAKTDSQGCAPVIGWSGVPSLSSECPFAIRAQGVLNQQVGMLVYGTVGMAQLPLGGGILCVHPPLVRTWPGSSGGHASPAVDCSGLLTLDFADWLENPLAAGLQSGQVVFAQFWYRDPFDPTGTGLSDAMGFSLWP